MAYAHLFPQGKPPNPMYDSHLERANPADDVDSLETSLFSPIRTSSNASRCWIPLLHTDRRADDGSNIVVTPTRPKRNRGHHSGHLVLPPPLNARVNAAFLSTPLPFTGNTSAANVGHDTVLGRARADEAAYEPPDDLTQVERKVGA